MFCGKLIDRQEGEGNRAYILNLAAWMGVLGAFSSGSVAVATRRRGRRRSGNSVDSAGLDPHKAC